ncbi:uroporphyrinogen-III synthase [Pannonibacter indicus]|uniref:Uroporphyrinogen-III synthase n=1 Tax=Pannonibacter indicus TaxID=466044 RepID=A0A0K6I0B0_9HYPH|nr:uroporphyrinogen-III synthase [Pannonibacter indicus]CUA96717.1 Uroporphyrinogen-III synthase [Pannonibacter indicus]
MRILVTRPYPHCARTAARLRDMGHEVIEAPALEIVRRAPDEIDLGGVDALAITSSQAIGALAGHRQLPELARLAVYTVGARTAAAARELGFTSVLSAGGDARDLSRLIEACHGSGDILYFGARDRSGDLEKHLAAAGIGCRLIEVYQADPVASWPHEVNEALVKGEIDILLAYSTRSAEVCANLLRGLAPVMLPRMVALSAKAGAPLTALGPVEWAETPDEEALFLRALNRC